MRKPVLIATICLAAAPAALFAAYPKCVSSNGHLDLINPFTGTYDLSGYQITVDGVQLDVDNLTIVSGDLMLSMGEIVTLDLGITFKTTAAAHSVALWYPGTFPNFVHAFNMVQFVQWGAGGQAYEAQADSVFLWTAGEFAPDALPICRDSDYSTNGASHWSAASSTHDLSLDQVLVNGNPFTDALSITVGQEATLTVHNAQGQLVATNVLVAGDNRVATDTWASGLYVMSVRDDKGLRKLIKATKIN